MNIRKEKLELYQALYLAMKPRLTEILSEEQNMILHLYLFENKGLMEIADQMGISNYKIVKDELQTIELKIYSCA
ncbi:MAG: hypothetical protein K2N05_09215 [Muribaculaceae bacterium]|nr:hypothetical protein [Muribaculaceae bacterium]